MGLLDGLFGGSSDPKSVTTNKPWGPLEDPLKAGYGNLQTQYQQGAPQYYPGQTIAPQNQWTQNALQSQAGRAMQGSPVNAAAQGNLTSTLQGDYLNAGNPYFQNAMNAAVRPITQQYEQTVMPGLDSTFSAAGRYGSGAHQNAANTGYQNYMQAVGDTAGNMAYQNYGDERARQMQGMLMAPSIANQDYYDINQLGASGTAMDQYNQQLLNSDISRHDYNQNKNFDWTSKYLGVLTGNPYGRQATTEKGGGTNLFTSALGGGMIAAGLPGATAGTALGGAGIGLLGGALFG
jgi:hypothetical protein